MSDSVEFPSMRANVIEALRSLGDPAHQASFWGVNDEKTGRYEDLSLCVNILYDCQVLPNPEVAVGSVLAASEQAALWRLARELVPLVEDLGAAPDAVYLADFRWARVVEASAEALAAMTGDG
jgi:hypothetical protein